MGKKVFSYIFAFVLGCAIYPLIEIMYRGYTHYSMAIAGGIGLFLIYLTWENLQGKNIFFMALVSACLITLIEFIFGVIFNIFLGENVWSYSELPLNIMGQVCLAYSVLWYLSSIPIIYMCQMMEKLSQKRS